MTIEFHFDFGSPNAYLSHLVIPAIEERTGETFLYVPVLLGGVFKATNNVSPMISMQGIKNKPDYARLETERFVSRHGLADRFRMNPHFPVNTLGIMRGAVAAEGMGAAIFRAYVDSVYAAMWQDPAKLDDPDVIRETLDRAGLPSEEIVAATQTPEIKAELIARTGDAVSRGVFGSPSFFVGEELYFGKDSLREVEEEIEAQKRRDR